ncbi:hypothetical protein D3C81_1220410 [compost metagenome]
MRWHDFQAVDALLPDKGGKRLRVLHRLVIGNMQRRAVEQRTEQRGVAQVGGHGRTEGEMPTRLQPQGLADSSRVVEQLTVLDHHTFGHTGRA